MGMYPGLNMSRAFGDIIAHKEAGLTEMPDIKEIPLHNLNGYQLLLCSDGVWEFIESKEAFDILKQQTPDGRTGVNVLVKQSWDRWMKDSDNEIADDITAVLLQV